MKKSATKPKRPAVPGTKKVGLQLPEALHEQMKTLRAARHLAEGVDPKVSRMYREAAEEYLASRDPRTGLPKPRPTPSPAIVIPSNMRLFGHDYDSSRFADDQLLHSVMDGSSMMLWAANAHFECTFVNRSMVLYTGREVEDFLRQGWAECVHPEDRDAALETAREGFRSHQFFRNGYRFRHRGGAYAWVVDNAEPRYTPTGNFAGYVGTLCLVAAPGTSVEIMAYEHGRWTSRMAVIVPGAPARPV